MAVGVGGDFVDEDGSCGEGRDGLLLCVLCVLCVQLVQAGLGFTKNSQLTSALLGLLEAREVASPPTQRRPDAQLHAILTYSPDIKIEGRAQQHGLDLLIPEPSLAVFLYDVDGGAALVVLYVEGAGEVLAELVDHFGGGGGEGGQVEGKVAAVALFL